MPLINLTPVVAWIQSQLATTPAIAMAVALVWPPVLPLHRIPAIILAIVAVLKVALWLMVPIHVEVQAVSIMHV